MAHIYVDEYDVLNDMSVVSIITYLKERRKEDFKPPEYSSPREICHLLKQVSQFCRENGQHAYALALDDFEKETQL